MLKESNLIHVFKNASNNIFCLKLIYSCYLINFTNQSRSSIVSNFNRAWCSEITKICYDYVIMIYDDKKEKKYSWHPSYYSNNWSLEYTHMLHWLGFFYCLIGCFLSITHLLYYFPLNLYKVSALLVAYFQSNRT